MRCTAGRMSKRLGMKCSRILNAVPPSWFWSGTEDASKRRPAQNAMEWSGVESEF